MEEVKEDLALKTKQAKKAEMLLEEFKSKAGNATNINDASTKLGITVTSQEDLSFVSGMINEVGVDPIMVGTAAGSKSGSLSKATAGSTGVFILAINSIKTDPEPADYIEFKSKREIAIKSRSDYEVFNSLKELAEIEQHKSRVD